MAERAKAIDFCCCFETTGTGSKHNARGLTGDFWLRFATLPSTCTFVMLNFSRTFGSARRPFSGFLLKCCEGICQIISHTLPCVCLSFFEYFIFSWWGDLVDLTRCPNENTAQATQISKFAGLWQTEDHFEVTVCWILKNRLTHPQHYSFTYLFWFEELGFSSRRILVGLRHWATVESTTQVKWSSKFSAAPTKRRPTTSLWTQWCRQMPVSLPAKC